MTQKNPSSICLDDLLTTRVSAKIVAAINSIQLRESSHYSSLPLEAQMRDLLVKRFNEPELANLCYDLNVSYDELPGTTLSDKARELVAYCVRREWLDLLIGRCNILRPNMFWPLLWEEAA